MQTNTFEIDPEFRDLLPPLMDDERERLMTDINKNGCRDPLVVWKEWNTLIDGHNRYEICDSFGLHFEVVEMSFPSRDDVKLWMIRNQLSRRNITDAKRVVLNLMLKPIIAAKAKEQQVRKSSDSVSQTFGKQKEEVLEPLHTDKEIAKASGVSHEQVRKVETVMKTADEPTKQKMLSGEISINKAYTETTKPHVANNSGNNEWYTPSQFIESAREVMQAIDLDPASCKVANKIVKAGSYFDSQSDGLSKEWHGRVWLNPPYSSALIGKFAEAVTQKFETGEIQEACVLVNNATETEWCQKMLRSASCVCFTSGRIKFLDATGVPANSPLQGQAIIYFGSETDRFSKEFSKHGVCFERCSQ